MYRIKETKAGILAKATFLILITIVSTVPLLWSGIAQAQTKKYTADAVQFIVEVDVCTNLTNPACSQLGVTGIPAAVGNSSPVLLWFQLIKPNGNPVENVIDYPLSGLNPADFTIKTLSGTILQKANCNSCFLWSGDGLYRVYVEPDPNAAGVWGSGNNIYQFIITVGANNIYLLFEIELP